jgi:hypothetical protein
MDPWRHCLEHAAVNVIHPTPRLRLSPGGLVHRTHRFSFDQAARADTLEALEITLRFNTMRDIAMTKDITFLFDGEPPFWGPFYHC